MTGEPVSYARRCADLAAAEPDRVAVQFAALDGSLTVVTWAELQARSNQIARGLLQRELAPGDRVALGVPNSVELVASALAVWKVGATPVPLRWDLPQWERDRVLEVIDPALALDGRDLDWIATTTALSTTSLADVVAPQTHGICSSGSTGMPKVILIDRPGTWDDTIGQPFPTGWMDVARPQRMLVPAPMYHTNGFMTLYNLIAGDELVVMERFDAGRVVDLIEQLGITTFTATPTMLQRIADLPGIDGRDLSSLVWVMQGAATVPPSLVRHWIDLIGADRFFMSYGMTEGVGLAALRADEWLERPGTIGRGYRNTEIRILDEEGHDLPAGEIGEIYLRSPASGMYQYLGGASRLETTEDGFGTAGDLGYLDEEDFLYIVDRRVDMIITGGANVYPAEVEHALIEHPQIADVVVLGLADPEWGRRVHAVIEPADADAPPTEAAVIAFAKERLAPYKVPKTVEIVDRIPRSEATKVSRGAMVEARGG